METKSNGIVPGIKAVDTISSFSFTTNTSPVEIITHMKRSVWVRNTKCFFISTTDMM